MSQHPRRQIEIVGPFSDDDLLEIIAVVRRADDRDPTGLFKVHVTEPEGTTTEGVALLQRLLPPKPGRVRSDFEVLPLTEFEARVRAEEAYRDPRCEERACDHCGELYRGPGVYCSLTCARSDA